MTRVTRIPPAAEPPPPPSGMPVGLNVGVVVVTDTSTGRARMGTGGPGVVAGHHCYSFQATNERPSNINYFFGEMGSAIPKVMYAAVAPISLAYNNVNPWSDADHSRLADTAAVHTFAADAVSYLNANTSIKYVNFWNELKGYNWGGDQANRDLFCSHYITFATDVKAARPDILIGGPYTTGGMSDANNQATHNTFATSVVEAHPDLVDFIVWDDGGSTATTGRPPSFYTSIYATGHGAYAASLPCMISEWSPGGPYHSPPISVGEYARTILGIAEEPKVRFLMHWGGGSDGAMTTVLWNSDGSTTAYWTAMNTVAGFTRQGGVVHTSTDVWTNAINQTCTVSGDVITVA